MTFNPENTPAATTQPLLDAILKVSPEDFRVRERLSFEPDGRGEHLWLDLTKRSLDTAEVMRQLQTIYAVGSADVGVAGLKDRQAVTRQWFSVRTPADASLLNDALASGLLASGALAVEGQERHGRKLRRGAHTGNAFSLVLRDIDWRGACADPARRRSAIDARLISLAKDGFPNYLGAQRFGRDGRNVPRALAWFKRPRQRIGRERRGLYLSAVRSELFNRVLADRVRDGSWCRLLDGEPAVLDGSRSFFMPDDAQATELLDRLARHDIHPSGPWWGRGKSLSSGDCLLRETSLLDGLGVHRVGLEKAGLEQSRRALRAIPRDLSVTLVGEDALSLSFTLTPGVFATVLLAEFGDCRLPARDEEINR